MSETHGGAEGSRPLGAALVVVAAGLLGGLFWLEVMQAVAHSLKRPAADHPIAYLTVGLMIALAAWLAASGSLARACDRAFREASILAARPFILALLLAVGVIHRVLPRLPNAQMFMAFLFVAVAAGMAAWMAALGGAGAVGGMSRRWPSPRRWLAMFCIAHALIFTLIAFARYDRLLCGLYDLGVFDNFFWHATNGRFFLYFEGRYDHCSPILLTCLPFYLVWSHPKALLLIQSALFALGALPLFALARERLKNERHALLFAALYFLYPFLARVNLYDFHAAAFLPLPFFGAAYFLSKGKLVPYFVCVAISLTVQENVAIAVFALGLFAAIRLRSTKAGVATMLLAVLWVVCVMKIWFPVILDSDFLHHGRYPPLLGPTLERTLKNIAKAVLNSFTRYYVLATLILALLPVGFLPLFDRKTFLTLACLPLVEQMLSTYTAQRVLRGHYAMSIIPVMLVASLFAFERATNALSAKGVKFLVAWLLTCGLLCNFFFGEPPFQVFYENATRYDPGKHLRLFSVSLNPRDYFMSRHERLWHAFKGLIPPDASVMAQNNLGGDFAQRDRIQLIGHPFNSDFCLFDPTTFQGVEDPKIYRHILDGLSSGTQYTCFFRQDGFRLFAKGDAWREVVRRAEARLAQQPDHRLTRYTLGSIHFTLGDADSALPHFAHLAAAASLSPEWADVFWMLGDLHNRRDDLPAAIAAFENGLRLSPRDDRAHYVLAMLYLQQGSRPKALAALQRALALNPHNQPAQDKLRELASPSP